MFTLLHPILIMILADADYYMMKLGYTGIIITDSISTESRDEKLGRVSSSHREKRAADLRCYHYKVEHIEMLKSYLEGKYYKFGAISKRTGKSALFVWGDSNHQDHIHIQIHKNFAISPN